MSNEAPTDALRLVPIDMQIESILHDLVQEVSAAQRGARVKARARQCCARGAAKNALLNLLQAAPASPLPEGGGWQDISTAPKDEVILLYGLLDPHPTERHLHARLEEPKRFTGYWDDVDDAWCPVGSTWEGPWIEPTHWMPLPAAPTGAK